MSIKVQVKTLSYCRTRSQYAHEAQFILNIKKRSQLKTYHKSASVNFGKYHAPLWDRHFLLQKHPFVFRVTLKFRPVEDLFSLFLLLW